MEIEKNFQKKNVTWRKKEMQMHVNEVAFRGDSALPDSIKDLNTPLALFLYFFDEGVIDLIVESINLTARRHDIETKFSVKSIDVYNFIGVCVYMSTFTNPSVASHWGGVHGHPIIQACMPLKRFKSITSVVMLSR